MSLTDTPYFLYASFLNLKEVIGTNLVCKEWKKASTCPYIWRRLLFSLCPDSKIFSHVQSSDCAHIFKEWSEKAMGARMIFQSNDLLMDVKKRIPGRQSLLGGGGLCQTFPDANINFRFERFSTIAPLFAFFPQGVPVMGTCICLKIPNDLDEKKVSSIFDSAFASSERSLHSIKMGEETLLEIKWVWAFIHPEIRRYGKNLIEETLECGAPKPRTIEASKRQEYCKTFASAWNSLSIKSGQYWNFKQIQHDWTPLSNVYGQKAGMKIGACHRAIWEFMGVRLRLENLHQIDPLNSIHLLSMSHVYRNSWIAFECQPCLPLKSYLEYC